MLQCSSKFFCNFFTHIGIYFCSYQSEIQQQLNECQILISKYQKVLAEKNSEKKLENKKSSPGPNERSFSRLSDTKVPSYLSVGF